MTSSEYYNPTSAELGNTWDSAALGWAKWEPTISAGLANATEVMIEMAGIRPGMCVLDVACGAGDLTVQIAERVGPTGSVVANDLSPLMLILLRGNAERAGVKNIEMLERAVEDLMETEGPFDAEVCRMSLALFPSPGKALEAIRRVLKPGGRFAALIFTTGANNLTMSQPMAILRRHADQSSPTSRHSRLFTLGDEGVLERLMKDSGFADVRTQIVLEWPTLLEPLDAMKMRQEAFGSYRSVVADLTPEEQIKAWIEVHECLKRFELGGDLEKKHEVKIGSGAKPS